ncbi:MAG TPA: hypothetical protein DCS07_16480 [Bdellovibrionales bacterium]|nr:MAG: hypothetical protein A2Z97_15815 [Bdellovibrionales bacterium GWB1_52_6]OFZ06421.1 MAG: hypothetical protein A2X97_03100 [Bdellovibrionales bacterium GWA1_52_35]OFZ40050.1 MAG: hypothetical protein A2070_02440 [Bdellovibrionales bacterium GWC1_52_8]HAR44202.1 hypothetical protein [Bdellovibrionales bacterium]HCM40180.1 hypothetical protein [Bdellovibrionales bacterium]
MRKLIFVVLGIVLLAITAAAVLPFVIDVDKYRPQLVELVNSKLNGKLELGQLKLSLWGQIRVNVARVTLKDATGVDIFLVKDAYFHVPFASLFGGSPELTFKMNKPAVFVTRSKAGKLNVMNLVKTNPEEAQATASSAQQDSAKTKETETPSFPSSSLVLPGFVAQARLSVELKDSSLSYRDQGTDLTTQVDRLNFTARNISLSRPMNFELKADLDTKLGKELRVQGPVRFDGKVSPQVREGRFENAKLELTAELSGAEINYGQLFQKKKGAALRSELAGLLSTEELNFDQLKVQFFNAEVVSSLHLTNQHGTSQLTSPAMDFKLRSNVIELKPWVELVPMLKDYELGGSVQLTADAKGPLDRLVYQAKLDVSSLTAKAPRLKARPVINGVVLVKTDQIENISLSMKAPGNSLELKGKIVSFTSPRLDLAVSSSGMDLDQLIEWPKKAAKTDAAVPLPQAASARPDTKVAGVTASSDFDALLAPLRESPIVRATSGVITVNLALLKAYDVAMSAMKATLSLKELQIVLNEFGMKMYDGSVRATAGVQLLPKTPAYQFSSQVFGLDLNKAVAAQFALFKNTLTGKANFDLAGSGLSFNPDPALQNLKAKGSMKVENASFATLDIGKMATEGLNNAIDKLSDKIPPLKEKKLGGVGNRKFVYQIVSSDFTLANGFFLAPNFAAKAAAGKGIDLKGRMKIGMKDQSLDMNWEVIDTFNLLKAKDIAIEQQGVRVEHILAEGNGPVKFPVHVGCTMLAPCYSYTQIPEYLGKVALANISRGLTGKAKSELKKKADEYIKNAPAPVQKKLEELGKKFKLFN